MNDALIVCVLKCLGELGDQHLVPLLAVPAAAAEHVAAQEHFEEALLLAEQS